MIAINKTVTIFTVVELDPKNVAELSNLNDIDVAFEAAGTSETFNSACQVVRVEGCVVLLGVLPEAEQTRSRKLLANRKEIDKLIVAKQQGSTIVPVQFLTSGRYVKLKISIAKGKKKYDKREVIKKREQSRTLQNF